MLDCQWKFRLGDHTSVLGEKVGARGGMGGRLDSSHPILSGLVSWPLAGDGVAMGGGAFHIL